MAFYIFPRAISKDDCDKYLKYCLKNSNWEDASTISQGYQDTRSSDEKELDEKSQSFDYGIRKTDVSFITDKDNMMNELVWGFIREANKQYFRYNLDYFQAIQFARYQNGGHYDWHQDVSGSPAEGKECRKLQKM